MKPLREIMDALRSALGAVNVELIDSDGNLREYDDIMAELSQTEEGLTQSEQLKNVAILFGKQNLSGMLAIINASDDDYEKLTNAIDNCDGTAQSMAETMQDNLEGQLTILMSQLQELAISFAEILMPTIRNIVTKIQEFADKLNALNPHAKETITKVALIVAAIAPLLIAIGKLTTGIGGLMTVFSKMPAIITKVKGAFTAIKTAITGISASVVAIAAVIAVLEDIRDFFVSIWETIQNAVGEAMDWISDKIQTIWNAITEFLTPILESIRDFFESIWTA